MSLLSKNKDKKDRLVGAQVPPRLHTYMSLYSAAMDTSKSKIVKHLLENWMQTEREKYSETRLRETIIKKINDVWPIERKVNPGKTPQEFREEVTIFLSDKGLDDASINNILSEVKL